MKDNKECVCVGLKFPHKLIAVQYWVPFDFLLSGSSLAAQFIFLVLFSSSISFFNFRAFNIVTLITL